MAVRFKPDQIPAGLKILGEDLPSPAPTTQEFVALMNKLPGVLVSKDLVLDVCPIGKPRMTQSDRWKKRPAVLRYREACDVFRAECARAGYAIGQVFKATFVLPMPDSWSKKKKQAMMGQPHLQKPDCDNIVKFCLDAGLSDDAAVHTIHVSKIWGETGKIILHP